MNRRGLSCLLLLAACQGRIGEVDPTAAGPGPAPIGNEPPVTTAPPSDPAALFVPRAYGEAGLRRLDNAELRSSLLDLYGVDPLPLMDALPQEGSSVSPFDNDYPSQSVSLGLIQALNTFAEAYASAVTQGPSQVYEDAGCTPNGAGDAACFEKVIRNLGRRSLRRPITDAEVASYAGLLAFSIEEDRFESGVELLIRAFIQHPEVLYRIEVGTPASDPGLTQLGQFEIATRIAFLISGSAPDAALLDAAESARLSDPLERRAQAERLFATPRAALHWERFFAMWLGYDGISLPDDRREDLLEETRRLIAKLVFEDDAPWLSIFTTEQSWVSPSLAAHYGVTPPAATGWIDARGGGILSHGTFLAQGGKFGDTSPTLRGSRLMQRVLCQALGTPPVDVDTDNPPPGTANACKPERYSMRNDARCASCHVYTDNIGFGLENLGASGEWRDTEPGQPSCRIEGTGKVLGRDFRGVAELGAILSESSEVESCATKQLFRFAIGRVESTDDRATLDALRAQLRLTPGLRDLVLAMAESPAIAHRPR